MSKKYFWLKLKDDFFTDKKIKKLRRIAGGDTYTIIYLKMQLLSLKHNGIIVFDDLTAEFYEEIALELDEDEENVKFTLMYLMSVGLVEEVDEKSIAMIETIDNIGKESESAKRVRALRERQKESQKALQCNVTEVTCNTEIEKEIEKELKINKDTLSSGKPNNVAEVMKKTKQLENLPNVRAFTDKRKKAINARIEEYGFQEVMNALDKMNNLAFFKDNKKSSWYTIDWVFNPNNFIKVIEGKYDGINFNKPTYNNKNSYQPYVAEQNVYQEKEIVEVNEEDLPF